MTVRHLPPLIVDEVAIEVVLKRIRHMHLRVYAPGDRVRLSAPLRIDPAAIHSFALSRLDWIRKHQRQLRARAEEARPTDPQRVCIWGAHRFLCIREGAAASSVVLDGDAVVAHVRHAGPRIVQRALEDWYRAQVLALAQPLVEYWSGVIDVRVNRLFVRSMKSRWGSCTPRTGRIRLSMALAQKPRACLEYVVVHELVHLLEASHDRRFVRFMDRFLPDWRARRRLLNEGQN